eukprot:TRINITY_DN1419_c0_g1_i1.p1 TRINITY_DN1419_c0_g1~~TRINITY_DN1419_c0_g1_i1.p1  ORF type:complete len:805 (-),score=189.51 TRINITY_DN1419_c0_g1_i1:82-2496(-)
MMKKIIIMFIKLIIVFLTISYCSECNFETRFQEYGAEVSISYQKDFKLNIPYIGNGYIGGSIGSKDLRIHNFWSGDNGENNNANDLVSRHPGLPNFLSVELNTTGTDYTFEGSVFFHSYGEFYDFYYSKEEMVCIEIVRTFGDEPVGVFMIKAEHASLSKEVRLNLVLDDTFDALNVWNERFLNCDTHKVDDDYDLLRCAGKYKEWAEQKMNYVRVLFDRRLNSSFELSLTTRSKDQAEMFAFALMLNECTGNSLGQDCLGKATTNSNDLSNFLRFLKKQQSSDDIIKFLRKSKKLLYEKATSIQVANDHDMSRLTIASFSSILFSLPAISSFRNNFLMNTPFGSSSSFGPGGLSNNGYNGHTFWDSEMFIGPILLFTFPKGYKEILDYRLNNFKGSQQNSKIGLRLPWESAATGVETCPANKERFREIHISADVIFAFDLYLRATGDEELFEKGLSLSFFEHILTYLVDRLNVTHDTYYGFDDIVGPDESHDHQNNDAYTNVVTKWAIERLCSPVAYFSECEAWLAKADKIYIPYDAKNQYILQSDDYDGKTINQPSVPMLGYPYNISFIKDEVRHNNLLYYDDKIGLNTYSTGSFVMVNEYLKLKNYAKAKEWFDRITRLNGGDFLVWHEKIPTNDSPEDCGVINFITGAGGYLQSVVSGYGGVEFVDNQQIRINRRVILTVDKVLVLKDIMLKGEVFSLNVSSEGFVIYGLQTTHSIKILFKDSNGDDILTQFRYQRSFFWNSIKNVDSVLIWFEEVEVIWIRYLWFIVGVVLCTFMLIYCLQDDKKRLLGDPHLLSPVRG